MQNSYESKFAETNGYRTHYIEDGEGHPVILIHGGGPGADGFGNWFGCMPLFAKHFRAIAIDLAGYGNTEEPAEHVHSQPARNDQLIAFIEALDLGPVTIVGNSMGGATGLGAAMKRPDLFANLILMGSAGLNYTVGRVAGAMQPLKTFDYTIEGMKRIAGHLGGKNFQAVPGMVEYRFELACRPNRKAAFSAIDAWIWEQGGLHYAEEDIAAVKTRSFIFSGKDDPIVILPQAFKFIELLENGTGYLLPHCGHWAMLEFPELFTRECIHFIQDGMN